MTAPLRIDSHVHVALLGEDPHFKGYGAISPWLRQQLVFRIMLLYGRIPPDQVSDRTLRDAALRTILTSSLDHVVCLALDPVYDEDGIRREERSHLWVDNRYILDHLQPHAHKRILLGASVHPYDPGFTTRVAEAVDRGAVLLKWLPSAQHIRLSDPRVRVALEFLATAGRGGRPLPLLLHCGYEGAIPSSDPRTYAYDYLSWGTLDRIRNALRSKGERAETPDIGATLANLRAGVKAGARVILAHCGLPFYAPKFLGPFEHSDFPAVRMLLEESAAHPEARGRFLADVSACVTPFRKSYFKDIAKLPPDHLLAASDFPVPVFELSADLGENLDDLRAMFGRGELDRIVVPQDNHLDVNWRELKHAFGEHPMFRTAPDLLLPPS